VDASAQEITIETVDRAVRDWFDRTVDARVQTPQRELQKVPVVFSSGERWAVGRTRQAFRDDNGVLILPIISVRRTSLNPDPTKLALGTQVERLQLAVRVDPDTNQVQNNEIGKLRPREYPPVYDVYTVPFPDRVIASYQLVVQAQFIGQMNDITQKIFRSLDIQKTFVAPFENDGRQPPRARQYAEPYRPVPPLNGRYVVGFMENAQTDAGNFEEFTDQERIVKYSTEFTVPCALQPAVEGGPPLVKIERTAYKVVFKDENVTLVSDRDDLDRIFGPS
jgi:hypothetical protein